MSELAELSVAVTAQDKISAVLSRVESQLDRTSSTLDKVAAGMQRGLGQAQQKAAQDALSHAQAEARLQAASGSLASGIRTLQTALEGVDRSSIGAIRAETQLVQMQTRLAKETQGSSQFVDAFKQGLFGLIAPAAAAGTALAVLKGTAQSFVDAFNFKAQLDATTASVKSQLDGFRDADATYAQAIQFGRQFSITQQQTNDILSSSTDILRTSTSSVGQLETALIRLQSRDVSKPISEASRALRELQAGDVTSIKELFNVPAKDALRMRDEIVKGGDAVQVLTAWLDQAKVGMDALAQRTEGAKGKMLELAQANEDLTLAQADFAQGPGLVLLEAKINVIRGTTRLMSGDFQAMGQSLHNALVGSAADAQKLNEELNKAHGIDSGSDPVAAAQAAQAAQDAYTRAILEGATQAEAAAARDAALAAALEATGSAAIIATGPMDAVASYQLAQAAAAQQAASANQKAADTILVQAAANQTNAQASVLAAAQNAAQQAAVQQLTEETNKEVSAFLAMNPLIDAAGIAALVAAGKIPALIGQLAALRIQAYSTRDAIAALAAQQAINTKVLATPGIAAPGVTSGRNNDINAVLALQKANQEAADARSQQILELGTDQQKVNELERQYGQAVKASGADSAAAINAETKLKKAREEAAKAHKKGGGTKLSDQTKLQNSLLASQEQYAQKSEDAERSHLDRVLQINQEFAQKIKKAQDDFGQSQLDSRASFYDSLSNIEDAGLRQALSQQYEQAFQEAQQIAATKGADVADAFLKAKQAALQAQAQRASEIAQATKEGDKDKAAYLAGVDKLYREAEDRKVAAAAAGDDSIAAERDAALAEEGQKYADAQSKIGDSADTAAQRKILAAERAGKAVDAEALKVDGLIAKYDALGQAGSRAGVTPVAGTTTPGAPPTPASAAAPAAPGTVDFAALLSAMDAIRAAVDAGASAIVRAQGDTTSAVRRAGNNGNIAG